MARTLRVVADDATTVLPALRKALSGGDAIVPMPATDDAGGFPRTVGRDTALVVQTSGSTGKAKRVALGKDALLASAAASESVLGGPGQWLMALPAHYIAGINVLVRSITAGTVPVVLGATHGDPLRFVSAASELTHERRFTAFVPAQLAKLIDEAAALDALKRFDRILVGGQSMPKALLAHALELGLNVTRTYGSSETSGGCVYDGVPIGETYMRVVEGEIELGGPTLANGYLDDAERTRRAFYTDDAGRWYRTNDSGVIIDGELRVTGRLDDLIVSGGIKVSLAAVERVVRSIPGLGDAVVVRQADDRWGEVPVVFSTTSATLEAVRDAVGAELGVAARPAEVVRVETIPLLSSGKPDRAALEHR